MLPAQLSRTDRPVLMGVVNVTPDSFSDGGRWATPDAAIAHGRELLRGWRGHPRCRGRVDPAGRDPAAGRGGAGPGHPGDHQPGRRGRRRLGRHHAQRGRAKPRSRPVRASSTTSRAVWPTRDMLPVVAVKRGGVRRHALARAQRHHAAARVLRRPGRRGRARCATSWPSGWRRSLAAGIDRDRIVLDPGLGLRQDGRAQLDAAARPGPAHGARPPGAGRRVPQVLPRQPARRPRRRGPRRRGPRARHAPRCTCCSPSRGSGGCAPTTSGPPTTRCGRSPAGTRRSRRRNRETDELSDGFHPGIECYGHHGVFDHEKRDGQTFVVDLTLGIDTAPAAATRRLARHRGLREPRGRGEACRGGRSGRSHRDPGPATRGRLPQGRSC